jgi:hypothetical protein
MRSVHPGTTPQTFIEYWAQVPEKELQKKNLKY